MAGGFAPAASTTTFEARITPLVIISCILASTGGLMFGFDVGISGTCLIHLISHFYGFFVDHIVNNI